MHHSDPATQARGGAPGAGVTDVAVLGEVLFDCFPDGPRLGGAPFNVAWHLAALGLNPLFVSRVGSDDLGGRIRGAMAAHGMALTMLQEDRKYPTGQVRITLDGHGGHTFEILPDQAYDHIERDPVLARLGTGPPRLVYFGTLCLRAPASHAAILAAVHACPGTRFLDVNLRADCWTPDTVRQALQAATVVKLNEDELGVLARLFAPAEGLAERAEGLRGAFDLDAVCVTRGETGALWAAGDDLAEVPSPPTRVVDTVGAGDGFAAVLITGLLRKWPPTMALERASDFASAICGMRGACPTEPAFYAPFREAWA